MRLTGEVWKDCITHKSTVSVINSGVATGGSRGQSATPDSEKFAKNGGGKGKNQEKSGKKRKKQGEKAKIGKALSLCPSW